MRAILGVAFGVTLLTGTLLADIPSGLALIGAPDRMASSPDAREASRALSTLLGVDVPICESGEPPASPDAQLIKASFKSQNDSVIDHFFGTDASPDVADAVAALRPPSQLRSVNGKLDVTLIARAARVEVGQYALNVAAYNGEYAGPVLRARPGDLLRVRLVNQLNQVTNLHFHGLEVTPQGAGDNMGVIVGVGQSHVYEIRIPRDHRPGVFWYHSHAHGFSERQLMAGLSGMLIIDEPEGVRPAFPGVREQLFVLKNFQASPDGDLYRVLKGYRRDLRTINGQLMPKIEMHPGETQLWRFSNQSADLIYRLKLEGHRFRVMARDASPAVEEATDELIIPSASRVDVLVEGGATGQYRLISERTMTGPAGDDFREQNIGLLVVDGASAPRTARMSPRAPEPDMSAWPVMEKRLVVFSEEDDSSRFYLNGRVFDHQRVDMRAPLGNIEEWTIRNSSDELHVFHIHQVNFQVVEVNGARQPYEGRVDNVTVPINGEVKIRIAFTNPNIVGRFMLHCHILEHEDKGMMAQIEVYDPKAATRSASDARAEPHGH